MKLFPCSTTQTSLFEQNPSKSCQSNNDNSAMAQRASPTRGTSSTLCYSFGPVGHAQMHRDYCMVAMRLQCKQSCHLIEGTRASSHTKQTHKATPIYSLCNDTLFTGYHRATGPQKVVMDGLDVLL